MRINICVNNEWIYACDKKDVDKHISKRNEIKEWFISLDDVDTINIIIA